MVEFLQLPRITITSRRVQQTRAKMYPSVPRDSIYRKNRKAMLIFFVTSPGIKWPILAVCTELNALDPFRAVIA